MHLRLTRWVLLLAAIPAAGVRTAPRETTDPVPASRVVGQPTAFSHITLEQGLSDQRVEALAQDHAGFLWFGTNNGLDRYDGYNVVVYRNDPEDPHSISGNRITVLLEDRSGTLWVGTHSGLSAFDHRTERFTNYRHDPANARSLSSNAVVALFEDRSGTLWVGTVAGLSRFDRDTGTFTTYRSDPANPSGLGDDNVRAITQDQSGALWIGTLRGLNRLDPATGLFTVFRHDAANPRSLSHDVIWDIQVDRSGRVWAGTDGGGLNAFDPATNGFTHYRYQPGNPHSLSGDRVAFIFEDASGALWVTTFGSGLSVLDPARQRFTRYRHDPMFAGSLSTDYLDEIIADRSGMIWIGTHGSGVDVYDPRRLAFTIYQHNPQAAGSLPGNSNSVWAVSEAANGVLWIGTQDSGLYRFDRRSGRAVDYPPDPSNPKRLGHPWVSALERDRTGALWVGTYGGGLYRLDTATGLFTSYRHNPADPRSLSHDAVADLHIDRSGTLWVGTRGGGLNRFDAATGSFTIYRRDAVNENTLGSDSAWTIAENPDGSLWIGSQDHGLNRLDPATGAITRYQHDPNDPTSLSDDGIWTLYVDRAGVLWVGTAGGGLDRFEPTQRGFRHYREGDGLASDRIISILEDGSAGEAAGNLWIATGRGLSRLDRDRKAFRTYDTTDGLPATEYNRGALATRDGEVLVSSTDGLIAFDPGALANDQEPPPVVFTNFLLANKPVAIGAESALRQTIDQTRSIELTYVDRVVSFEFAALSYRGARQSRYRYRLEGFDNDWIEVGSTQRLVTYTNLAPRTYVFRVTAANADGVWNAEGRAITLVVTPPWWETWWFKGLVIALVAGSATGLYAWRVNRLERRRRALEAEIVERKRVEETLRTYNRHIQDLAGRVITAQEAERTRIARELHDDVNQQLAVLAMSVSSLKHALPADAVDQQRELEDLQEQAVMVSASIRHLSHELHPGLLHHAGLVEALRERCEEFSRLHKIEVPFRAEKGLGRIASDVALCLYRVTQEALQNAARHAGANRIEVTLAREDAIVELRIADDGRGFDTAKARERGGLGLLSIDERVRAVAGQAVIASEPQRGTVISVRVPLQPETKMPTEGVA